MASADVPAREVSGEGVSAEDVAAEDVAAEDAAVAEVTGTEEAAVCLTSVFLPLLLQPVSTTTVKARIAASSRMRTPLFVGPCRAEKSLSLRVARGWLAPRHAGL